jgi:nucleoside-diphosphate-sugar epimerase
MESLISRSNVMPKEIICVTGGAGFTGIALVRRLLTIKESVRILDSKPIDADLRSYVDFRAVDITDKDVVMEALQGCHTVYHLAAEVPTTTSPDFQAVDVQGTENVLEGAKRAGAKRFVFTSTSSPLYYKVALPVTETSLQNPVGAYGRAKQAAEALCRTYRNEGLNVSIVRPRATIGAERLGIFSMLFTWLKDSTPIIMIGDGTNRMQYLGRDDLVDFLLLLREKGDGEDYNLGASTFGTYRGDLETLGVHAGSRSPFVPLWQWFGKLALLILYFVGKSPLSSFHIKTIAEDFWFDTTKARSLGWTPKQSNTDMLKEAWDWYITHTKETAPEATSTHRSANPHGERMQKIAKFFEKWPLSLLLSPNSQL